MPDKSPNPYESPQDRDPPGFLWRYVPYAIYRGWRGYVAEMRRTKSRAIDHIVVWFVFFLFVIAVVGILSALLGELVFEQWRLFEP